MLHSNVFFLGCTLRAARSVPAAPAPSNYKDPAKIAEKERENAIEALAISASIPTAGVVESFVLLDHDGEHVRSSSGSGAVIELLDELWNQFPGAGDLTATSKTLEDFALVGFGVHAVMRVACLEALAFSVDIHDRRDADYLGVPAVFYRGEQHLVDPYTTLLHTDARKYVSVQALLTHLRIPFTDSDFTDTYKMAVLARELTCRAQLFGERLRSWPGRSNPLERGAVLN